MAQRKKLIKKYFRPKSSVDIGCGTGRTTIPLHKMGYKVVGIDMVSLMIKNAKKIAKAKRLKIRYEVGDATKLKFTDNSFDNALFSYNGWAQIPGRKNRQKALQEIFRVLRPNGYFIFTTHVRGFRLLWVKQWIKLFLLKPLGFKIREIEVGDRFFKDRKREEQYINIPAKRDVLCQIFRAGFELVYNEKDNVISPKDKNNIIQCFTSAKNTLLKIKEQDKIVITWF